MPSATPAAPKPRRIPPKMQLRDASCAPGVALMNRIVLRRKPAEEDVAIVDSYAFRIPVTLVPCLPY